MFMDVQLIADLESIRGHQQQLFDQNIRRHNKKWINYHYRILGELVKMQVYEPSKLGEQFTRDHITSLK